MEQVLLLSGLVGLVFEFALHLPIVWRARKILALLAGITVLAASVLVVAWQPNVFSIVLGWLGLYRLLNAMRIVKARMHERYLHRATLRTSLALAGMQIVVIGGWWAWNEWHTTGVATWTLIAVVQFGIAMSALAFTLRTIRRTSWPQGQRHYSNDELPTLTVAIPARNETDDLHACLQTLVASDYPKLEVIVLDDCSQTRRTPEIIRGFAQDGVRFVAGEEPGETWLAKNQAYDRLMEESSGQYILFCGVDVRFAPDSLRKLVSRMLAHNKVMASVLPRRSSDAYGTTSLVQAMRYWWELVPPRRLLQRPPVLSTCWVIKRDMLKEAGGFRSVARAIVPEAHFARFAARQSDGYGFWRAGKGIDIESGKTVSQQRATAIRMRYPQVHRRPEQVALQSFLEIACLLLPFGMAVVGFWVHIGPAAQIIAFLTCLILVAIHELVVLSTHVNTWWFGLVAPPFMIITDLALLHYSMGKYEFSTVEWKGRNICIPAMYVIPHLPKI